MVSGHQRCKELSLVEEITAMAGRLVPNLAIRPVVETVIQAMQALPADMPAVFRNAYKVTNHPGTPEQVRNTQMGSILAWPIGLCIVCWPHGCPKVWAMEDACQCVPVHMYIYCT